MSVPDWVEIANKLVTPAIAALSAFYVYLQYRRAQRWKAGDLAMSLLGELQRDPALALACQSMDWGVGPLLIPEPYRAFFAKDGSGELPKVMQHDPAVLARALKPALDPATLADPRGLVYRHCFIRLFEHLDDISRLLDTRQLAAEDLQALKYWVRVLHDYPYAPAGSAPDQTFMPALAGWGFIRVTQLHRKLGF